MNKLVHVFFGVNMSAQHDGLLTIMSTKKLKPEKLAPGEMVCFINNARDRIKILARANEENTRGVIGYYRSPRGNRNG